jgi:phenylalanyl-tRNA synthetase alpha chain
VLNEFLQIGKDALESLKKVTNPAQLEEYRIRFLARKGIVTDMLSKIGSFPAEQRKEAGALANKIKQEVTGAFDQLKITLQGADVQKGPITDVKKARHI